MRRELADVGRRIAEARKAAGLTQEKLAEQVDCTPRFLRSVETSGANVTVAWLADVADALGVSLRSLFDPQRSRARTKRGRPRVG